MKKLLDVRNLHLTFHVNKRNVFAVRDISFSLHEGETLGIVGESGCGKSATAKAIVKLIPPHSSSLSGEVWFEGKNLMAHSEKQMQKIRGKEIGMIFQDPMTSLNPTLRIGNQIMEGYLRHNSNVDPKNALQYTIELLELVGISQARDRFQEYPHTLSGGMRQRAMIALALACKPKLLIADEPTTSLDVTIQAQILDLMKKIQQKTNTSIVLITHDLSVVANFCDRVLVMYAGKIVENASVEDLFSHPQHPYTQRLLNSIPRLNISKDYSLIPIEGTPPDLMFPPKGCAFCARCPFAMNICQQQDPPHFSISKTHTSSCWQHDARKGL
jgi:oligopeptide transport system ATP-binding protein